MGYNGLYKMRILVVEDDEAISEMLSDYLTSKGFAIDIARDGAEAYSILEIFPFDLVILDIMLPKMNGYEVIEKLRAENNNVPVLMLTARDSTEDKINGLELGADDYLVKPFHMTELHARLLALLRRSKGRANNRLVVGRLDMDISKKTVLWENKELSLSAREFSLLEFFALNSGGYYTRENLLEHVWAGEDSINPRTVDTYILYLRRKLGNDAIKTTRGLGYSFSG